MAFFAIIITLNAQQKQPLNHTVYNNWKSIANTIISNDGNFVSYEINPQEGDGKLFLYNKLIKSYDSIQRGYRAKMSSNSNMLIFKIKPEFDTVRAAKLKKVKKSKLPKDSLGILITNTGAIKKYANLISYQVPKDESNWLAFLIKQPKINKDSTTKDSTISKAKSKKSNMLVILNAITGDSISFKHVTKYAISKNGNICTFISTLGDTTDSVTISYYNTNKQKLTQIYNKAGYSKNISIDNQGKQIAFTYSSDTIKEKAFGLYYYSITKNNLLLISGNNFSNLKAGWSVSKNGNIYFNKRGNELYFGTAPKPIPTPKDTLTDDEKVSVDIWNWKDTKLQPMQLKELENEKKRSFAAVYFPSKDKVIQLESEKIKNIHINTKASGKYSLGYDFSKYQRMQSWEASRYKDVYLINRETGDEKIVLQKVASSVALSPNQQNIIWYNIADSSWNNYNIKTQSTTNLTGNLSVNFYYELNDVPNEAYPYGFAGWTKNSSPIIYDRYDLWLFDINGHKKPQNITSNIGRQNIITFRYVKLNKDEQTISGNLFLNAFNNINKDEGYYSMGKIGETPIPLIMESFDFSTPLKAKNSNTLIWTKQSFKQFPDLYLSTNIFTDIVRLTDANPQQKIYNWGTVELVDWVSFNGDSLQGLLYKPENFDENKKYPMLVYFYERYSDRIHRYYTPKPIRSVINFSYYVSNEYLIFIPDIVYSTGYPGPSAFDCIISGTQTMCDRYNFIDRSKLGIQGQSWGGYQVAYLVTQTNMFKAAMAGAPVSNMTSAYGGIRWGSGMSRAFQYEQTQSRIGGNLWDKLPLYMLNSPLFSADRIETPLLIMHNDNDGAVPWYQGIELFNAMRRLNKPVWMMVYNGAPHNLKRRADSKDLTIRMQQFFDYFLKDAPEPVWMKYGIPAIKKGKTFGFENAE